MTEGKLLIFNQSYAWQSICVSDHNFCTYKVANFSSLSLLALLSLHFLNFVSYCQ